MRSTLRSLSASPGYVAIAVVTLALGIGVNTTMFSVANEILFRATPFVKRPSELVMVCRSGGEATCANWSWAEIEEIQRFAPPFTGLATFRDAAVEFRASGAVSERISAMMVSGEYFQMLGVPFVAGRDFTPAESKPRNGQPVAVISPRFCQNRFGSCDHIVGRSITLNGVAFTIVGMISDGFRGTELGNQASLWIPLATENLVHDLPAEYRDENRTFHILPLIARLARGVTAQQATARLAAAAPTLNKAQPASEPPFRVVVAPGIRISPENRAEAGGYAWLLVGISALVLLVACANVANLVLARATRRRREIATRLALGASRTDLVRHFAGESIVIGTASGIAGLLLNSWAIHAIPWIQEPGFDYSPDLRVFLFIAGIASAIILAFGIIPAFHISTGDVAETLKQSTTGYGPRSRTRDVLVVVQIALSLVLMTGAGMGVRILQRVAHIPPGFEPRGLVVTSIDFQMTGYDEKRGRILHAEILRNLASSPGFEGVTLARSIPIGETWHLAMLVPGMQKSAADPFVDVLSNSVTPDYFRTLEIPLLSGRGFAQSDIPGAQKVAVVSQAMARKYWPGQNPLGKQFQILDTAANKAGAPITIVGIVRDVHSWHLNDKMDPLVYLPLAQQYQSRTRLIVRSQLGADAVIHAMLAGLKSVDPAILAFDTGTGSGIIDRSLQDQRNSTNLIASLGTLATLLAAIGLYALLSYSVAQRSRDFALRIALGAEPQHIRSLVLVHSSKLAAIGLVIGLGLSLALARTLVSILYESDHIDPISFVTAAALLSLTALAAAWIPAERAIRSDPARVLRQE